MIITKPMLAGTVDDVAALRYPLLASPKLDGIRCVVIGDQALSRSFKPIQNEFIRKTLESLTGGMHGFDGELMLRRRGSTFQDVSSAIMSRDGAPDFVFNVFDCFASMRYNTALQFRQRFADLKERVARLRAGGAPFIRLVPHKQIYNAVQLLEFEAQTLAAGYEGVMLRDPEGPYKMGRSTLNEGYLLKLKRFEHGEAVIVGFEEQERNDNPAFKSEVGKTKRSTAKAGKVGKGTLGAFIVSPIKGEISGASGTWRKFGPEEFRIGGGDGLTAALRQEIWDNQEKYITKVVRFRWQAHGTKDAPRIPQFEGFRSEDDL